MASKITVRLLNPPALVDPSHHLYSHSSIVKRNDTATALIHTAGQIGITKTGVIPSEGHDEVVLALENLASCLYAAGASVRDIIKLTILVVVDPSQPMNIGENPAMALLHDFLAGHRPPSTCIPVMALAVPGAHFEIDAVAVVHNVASRQVLSPAISLRDEIDVVIVGAGLSGLQAAYDVQKAGLSCLVLEARDRVGGKTWSVETDTPGKGIVDLGAAWINDSNQSMMASLATRFGLELIEQNVSGDCLMEVRSKKSVRFEYGGLPDVCVSAGTISNKPLIERSILVKTR